MTEEVQNPDGSPDPTNRRHPGTRPEYKVIPERRLVFVKFGKRVTESEIAGYAASLRVDPLFDPRFSEIVDLRTSKT